MLNTKPKTAPPKAIIMKSFATFTAEKVLMKSS